MTTTPKTTGPPDRDGPGATAAGHDPLTGLPNGALAQRHLEEALARARTGDTAVALLYVDLDDFKLVNDSLGRTAGDVLLAEVAERLKRVIRRGDVLARRDGDQFIVVLADVAVGEGGDAPAIARAVAERCGERIAAELEAPFSIGDSVFLIEASIGISLFPGDAADESDMHRHADAAMYDAKRSRTGWSVYQDARPDPLERLSLAARLKTALAGDQLELHYQPIFELAGGDLIGVEALARWTDTERGPVPPVEFIPVAERTGLSSSSATGCSRHSAGRRGSGPTRDSRPTWASTCRHASCAIPSSSTASRPPSPATSSTRAGSSSS